MKSKKLTVEIETSGGTQSNYVIIEIPNNTSDLDNDSKYATTDEVNDAIAAAITTALNTAV